MDNNNNKKDESSSSSKMDANPNNNNSENPTTRRPFTNLSQVDADLALARTLQDQERAYMLLRMNNNNNNHGGDVDDDESDDHESWETGSYVNDDELFDHHNSEQEQDEDDDADAFDIHAHLGSEGVAQPPPPPVVELDPASFPNDEAYARALQDAEDQEMAARLLALTGIHDMVTDNDQDDDHDDDDNDVDDDDDHHHQQDTWNDVDPDELSYEIDSHPNHVAANVVVAPLLPPTITNPVLNNAKRVAHEEPQQVMCTKKHKTDVQSNLREDRHHCQHNKVDIPSDKKSIATTQDSHKGSTSNDLLEYGDETFKEMYQHTPDNIALKLNNKLLDHSERLDLAIERTIHPATSHATGSKTLYLGNLSFAVEEDDVRDFFKDVGEIAAIRFAIRDDRFLGYGHIEFTTSEAAQEALKLNKEVLYDRRVKLDLARERGTYPPGNSMAKYNSTGGQAQRKTVFVRGFHSSDGFDIISSALEKHFRKCGQISRLSIPKDYDGAPKGIAFIDFVDTIGFSRALRLDGSVVSGNRLTVQVAKKSDVHEGSGCGGRGWSLKSGSSGGWVRENGSGWGRGNGSIRGWGREIVYAGGAGRESILGPGPCRESGSASGSHRGSCFASSSRRESTPASTSRPESVSASTSSRESCHGSSLLRQIDFDGRPRRGNGFGSGPPRGNGFNSGPPRRIDFCSGPPKGNSFGCGPPRGNGFGCGPPRAYNVGRSWHAEIGFGRGSGIDIRSDSSWHRESSSRIGRCGVSGYGRHDRGR